MAGGKSHFHFAVLSGVEKRAKVRDESKSSIYHLIAQNYNKVLNFLKP
jgi:hypothetical protein